MVSVVPFIAVLVMLALAGGAVAFAWHRHRRSQRQQQEQADAYRRWAAERGFHYWPRDFSALALSTLPPFGFDRGHHTVDVFRGAHRGAHLHCFELRYLTSSGDSMETHHFQVVAIGLPAARPLLDVSRESFLSKRFGEDLEFENQAFNDRFKVQSTNARFAHDVIHARMMEWMLADPRASSYQWRFEGPWLMAIRPGRLDLNELFPCADFLHEVLGRVPRHVWGN